MTDKATPQPKDKEWKPSNTPPPPESLDVEDQPNAVPDPWHDTRGVHGDTGHPLARDKTGKNKKEDK